MILVSKKSRFRARDEENRELREKKKRKLQWRRESRDAYGTR